MAVQVRGEKDRIAELESLIEHEKESLSNFSSRLADGRREVETLMADEVRLTKEADELKQEVFIILLFHWYFTKLDWVPGTR